MSPSSLHDRYGPWALVTGASSGMGEQFARQLAAEGFHLLITARRTDRLEQLAEELRQQHAIEVIPVAADLANPTAVEQLLTAIGERDLGLLVSNAGFGLKGLHHELDANAIDQMLNVNLRAPTLLIHALTPALIARGRGGIILTGSIEGLMGFPYSSAYAASKAYIKSLGESLWSELKPLNVDVLTVAPGSTDTEALTLQGFDKEQLSGLMPPAEVARQALDQLGRRFHHITGLGNRLFIRLLSSLPRRWGLAIAHSAMRSAIEKGAQS